MIHFVNVYDFAGERVHGAPKATRAAADHAVSLYAPKDGSVVRALYRLVVREREARPKWEDMGQGT